jgi:hypothetical protein
MLEDYGSILQSGMNLVPDYNKQVAFQVGLDSERLQQQALKQQIAAGEQKVQRANAFQTDLGAALQNPTAQNISAIIMKYPEFADQVKGGWDTREKAVNDADLTHLGEIYTAASSGNWDLAKKAAQARFDADKAAGNVDPMDEQVLGAIDKASQGDVTSQKAVLGLIGTHLAAVTGPEHFASVYGALKGGYTLDAGAARYDENGNMIAESPFIKGADGTIYERDGANGTPAGNPAPATRDTTPGGDAGFDRAMAFTLPHEGGYNPHDMNGAPVNFGINQGANPGVDVKNLTQDEAKQIYKSKYWAESGASDLPAAMQVPYFDTYIINPKRAKQFLAQSKGDPTKFMDLREAWMSQVAAKNPTYAKAYANRNADLRLLVNGGANAAPQPASEQGAAPPGFHVLVPGKQKEAPTGYQWSSDGKTLNPIPGGPADDSGLDPPTVQFFAQQYLTTGQLPPLGMGKSATKTRQQIMKQAAKIAGADGLTGTDLALQMAHYRAGVANISNLEKQLGTVSGNEATFAQNAQQVAQLARQLPAQTGSRILNTPIQEYLRQTNDPTVAALDVALKTAANEYARLVTASPSGAGTLSDSARTEYQSIIEGNFPLAQKLSALHQMSVDANNRTRSLRSTLQDSYKHLSDRAPELRGDSKPAPEQWITLPSGLKIRKIK